MLRERAKDLYGRVKRWANYEIEIITQLIVTVAAGVTYGIMEAKFIDTAPFDLPILGRFSYYHVGLLTLMFIVSSTLCFAHIQWILKNRKRYMLWMVAGSLPLALWVEDATWFLVRWQPITRDEWTMISPGWGINFGITWIPYWYFVTWVFVFFMFRLAGKSAKIGYQEFLKRRTDASILNRIASRDRD